MHALIPFCTSIRSPTFYQDFIEGLEDALAELGHTSERFAFAEIGALSQSEMERFFDWARSARCDLVLDLCCWGFALSRLKFCFAASEAETPVFDALGARYAALLFDQPYFQPAPAIISNSLLLCHPDRGHAELIDAIYPSFHPRSMLFLPPATRSKNNRSPVRWRDRHIPMLYAGNLVPDAMEPFWRDIPQRRLYGGVAELIETRPEMPLHHAVEQVRQSLAVALTQEERLAALRSLELFLRHRLRYRVVTQLAASGLPIELYGNGWEAVRLPPNVRLNRAMDYEVYMGLIGDARLCLDASTYLGGANDRVMQFAANGTAFFSNAQIYLGEAFGAAAEFYSPLDLAAAAGRIGELLARPAELEARSEQLREIAAQGHLWRHRLESIIAAMA